LPHFTAENKEPSRITYIHDKLEAGRRAFNETNERTQMRFAIYALLLRSISSAMELNLRSIIKPSTPVEETLFTYTLDKCDLFATPVNGMESKGMMRAHNSMEWICSGRVMS
jgi:hypothetical protein